MTIDRIARVDQSMQDVDQLLDIGHVQADGGLIENVQCSGVRCRLQTDTASFRSHLRQLRHQLDALRLASRKRRTLLTERQIAEANLLQQPQRMVNARVRQRRIRLLSSTFIISTSPMLLPLYSTASVS